MVILREYVVVFMGSMVILMGVYSTFYGTFETPSMNPCIHK